MKNHALVLCALLWASGVGGISTAQAVSGQPSAGATGALGKAQVVDETALSLGDPAADQAQPAANAGGQSTIVYFLRMILVLALVLVAIWLVFRMIKRAQGPKEGPGGMIKLLASTSLGQGKSVHLVGLGGKAWLLGASESSVSLISAIDDKDLLDELSLLETTEAPPAQKDFSTVLGSLLGRRGSSPSSKAPPAGSDAGLGGGADFLAQARDRLKKF